MNLSLLSPRFAMAFCLLGLLAGCGSTTIRDAWGDADYRGAPFTRVLVFAALDAPAERRTMEDIVSQKINATGSQGIPSYLYTTEDKLSDEAWVDLAVRTSGADALLTIRLKSVELRTQVTPQFAFSPSIFYGGGWSGWGWGLSGIWYGSSNVYQYDVATSEITLTEAKTKKLLWTAMVETTSPRPVAEKAPELADKVIKALQQRRLLPGRTK